MNTMKRPDFTSIAKQTRVEEEKTIDDRFAKADQLLLNRTKPEIEEPQQSQAKPKAVPKAKEPKPKPTKEKTVRDIFSMPESSYQLINKSLVRAAQVGSVFNKSQMVRIALLALDGLTDTQFETTIKNFAKQEVQRKHGA